LRAGGGEAGPSPQEPSAATIHEIIRRIQDALPHGEHSQIAPLYPTWEAAVRIFDALRPYFEPPFGVRGESVPLVKHDARRHHLHFDLRVQTTTCSSITSLGSAGIVACGVSAPWIAGSLPCSKSFPWCSTNGSKNLRSSDLSHTFEPREGAPSSGDSVENTVPEVHRYTDKRRHLRRGNPGNNGGGGRPYSIIRHAQKLASKHKLLDFLAECAAGYPLAQTFQTEGGIVVDYVPARPADRQKCAQLVLAYGHGQPPEKLVVEGTTVSYVVHAPAPPASVEEWHKRVKAKLGSDGRDAARHRLGSPKGTTGSAGQLPVEEVCYGGARGGGKTYGLLGDVLIRADRHKDAFRGILFRRSFTPELEEIIDQTKRLFPKLGWLYNAGTYTWTAPNGAVLLLRHLDNDTDADLYQGHQYCWMGFDEVGNFPDPAPIDKLWGSPALPAGRSVRPTAYVQPGRPGTPLGRGALPHHQREAYEPFFYQPQAKDYPELRIQAVFIRRCWRTTQSSCSRP